MTREEARYYLQSSGFSEEQMNTIEQAFKKEPKWIPVSERLPENRKEVLVTDGTDIFTGWYEGDKWCSCYEEFWPYSDPIIAWMPLPKPYEPQERSDKDADKECTYKETGCGSCKRQLDCPIEADKESEGRGCI